MRSGPSCFPGFLVAGFLALGILDLWRAVPAAAEAGPQPSLSGVLPIPASPREDLPVRDPFRSPILPREATLEREKAWEPPPLQVTAILEGQGRAAAVINGTILRPGDTLLDMTVLEIAKNRVLLQRGAETVTVFLQESLYNPLVRGGK